MKWSPAIAGKRGKCKCGATVEVPKTLQPPEEEDPLSALDIPLQQVDEAAQANYEVAAAPAAPLSYATPSVRPPVVAASSASNSKELVQDYYLPAGVLAVGFVLLMAWLVNQGAFFFAAVVTTILVASVLMVVKTGALSLFAWGMAKSNGGSFGNPLSTILKIAGLVVSLDAVTLWALWVMVATGAISRDGTFYIRHTLSVLLLVTFVVAFIVAYLVYRLDTDEAKLFSRLLSTGNMAMNILLVVMLAAVGRSAANVARTSAASQWVGAQSADEDDPADSAPVPAADTSRTRVIPSPLPALTGQPAPAPDPPPVVVVETPRDEMIWHRITGGNPNIRKLKDWVASPAYRDQDATLREFLEKMASRGSINCFVDNSETKEGLTRVYVELPLTEKPRDACFDVVKEFQEKTPDATLLQEIPNTNRYLEMNIGRYNRFAPTPAQAPASR